MINSKRIKVVTYRNTLDNAFKKYDNALKDFSESCYINGDESDRCKNAKYRLRNCEIDLYNIISSIDKIIEYDGYDATER